MFDYQFGYPEYQRIDVLREGVNNSKENFYIEYHGKYRPLPIAEVRIEVLVYRMENIRTKNLQKQWIVEHPDLQKDIFVADPFSIEAQENQHQILMQLADKENLMSEFKDGLQQTDPIICSDNGIVVNGNRRLCVWRNLYYANKEKYKHFETVRVAVLPDHDSSAMYDLEVYLQIRPDMKAEYSWHAIAADCKEKQEHGTDISIIASKHNKSNEEITLYIDCYDYAAEYLNSINRIDEWSLVDKQFYAFQQIVKNRKSITAPGDKALFQEISQSMLLVPAQGSRLYDQIPKVVKNLDDIAPKLREAFDVTETDDDDSDLNILIGNDKTNDANAVLASAIHNAENPQLVVDTVKAVIEIRDELEKEKKKKGFVLDQVKKAATALNNAVSNLNDIMTKDGVDSQLKSIEVAIALLKDWIK